jgi:hypothetical protein
LLRRAAEQAAGTNANLGVRGLPSIAIALLLPRCSSASDNQASGLIADLHELVRYR